MKPKILFILHIPPPVHGSAMVGKYIKDSLLINNSFNCHYINLSTSNKIDKIGKIGIKKIYRYVSILWQVFYNFIAFKPDLCYITITAKGSGFYKDSIVVIVAKLFKVKLLYHFHNKGVSLRQPFKFDNFLYKIVFHNTYVILLSKLLYYDIQKYVSEDRVYICPNGIPEKVSNDFLHVSTIKKQVVQILFLSNLIKSKGVFDLLNACRILLDKKILYRCVFVGGEGDIDTIKFNNMVLELKLNNVVAFVGMKFDIEKSQEFDTADIFVLPTSNDTFPLVNIEAMQYGLPVVSTFQGGIPDIVEDGVTGFLIPPKDPVVLADKLESLIKNPDLRRQMGQAGRKRYEEKFTFQIFEKNLKNIFDNLLSIKK